jgi:hypothetical protein
MPTSCLMEWLSDFCGVDDGDASGDGTVHWHGRRPLCSGDQPAWTSTPLLWRSTVDSLTDVFHLNLVNQDF